MERHGRFVMLSNNASPEEHEAMLRRSAEVNREIMRELDTKVRVLQTLVGKFDPLELMYRAACTVLPLMMQHQSEQDYSPSESLLLPGLEYLQYLIARTPVSTTREVLTNLEWSSLWEATLKIVELTNHYLLSRKMGHSPPSPTDELRFVLDLRRLIIRVQRYPIFLRPYLESTLLPYSQNIESVYGVSAQQIIEQLMLIDGFQKTGIRDRNFELFDLQRDIALKLAERGLIITADWRWNPMHGLRLLRALLLLPPLKTTRLQLR